jgi:hypothetical protein
VITAGLVHPEASVPVFKPAVYHGVRSAASSERLKRWRKMALIECGDRFQQVFLVAPFFELVAELIFPVAVEGRYLGGGRFQINDIEQLISWIT